MEQRGRLSGVTYVSFDSLHQFRRHFADAVFPGVLGRFLEHLLFRLTSYDVITPARRVYLGTFKDLCHGITPFSSTIHYCPLYI